MLRDQDLSTYGGKNQYTGLYRGIVEYVNDPLEMNRVKVRIPTLHKTKEVISTQALPWAFVSTPFGGAGNFGFIWVPPVGSMVWVMFEHGDINNPIVMGAVYGVPATPQPMGRISGLPKGWISMSADENTPWSTTPGVELPEDAQRRANMAPEVYVLKTPKGHTIVMEDRDETEHLSIIDRAGQSLLFEAEVYDEDNAGNQSRRVLGRADENDGLTRSRLAGSGARIEITDAGGNRIQLYSKSGSERVTIASRIHGGSSRVQLELNAADGTVRLYGIAGQEITELSIDAITGEVSIKGDLHVLGSITASGAITGG